jgi:hypothetical protein
MANTTHTTVRVTKETCLTYTKNKSLTRASRVDFRRVVEMGDSGWEMTI